MPNSANVANRWFPEVRPPVPLLPWQVDWLPHLRPWGMGAIPFAPPPLDRPPEAAADLGPKIQERAQGATSGSDLAPWQEAKNGSENYCFTMRTPAGEKLKDEFEGGDKDDIEKGVQETLDWLDKNQLGEKDEFETKQ